MPSVIMSPDKHDSVWTRMKHILVYPGKIWNRANPPTPLNPPWLGLCQPKLAPKAGQHKNTRTAQIQNREQVRSRHFEPRIRDDRAVEGEKQQGVIAGVTASKRNDEVLAIFVCCQATLLPWQWSRPIELDAKNGLFREFVWGCGCHGCSYGGDSIERRKHPMRSSTLPFRWCLKRALWLH